MWFLVCYQFDEQNVRVLITSLHITVLKFRRRIFLWYTKRNELGKIVLQNKVQKLAVVPYT